MIKHIKYTLTLSSSCSGAEEHSKCSISGVPPDHTQYHCIPSLRNSVLTLFKLKVHNYTKQREKCGLKYRYIYNYTAVKPFAAHTQLSIQSIVILLQNDQCAQLIKTRSSPKKEFNCHLSTQVVVPIYST